MNTSSNKFSSHNCLQWQWENDFIQESKKKHDISRKKTLKQLDSDFLKRPTMKFVLWIARVIEMGEEWDYLLDIFIKSLPTSYSLIHLWCFMTDQPPSSAKSAFLLPCKSIPILPHASFNLDP